MTTKKLSGRFSNSQKNVLHSLSKKMLKNKTKKMGGKTSRFIKFINYFVGLRTRPLRTLKLNDKHVECSLCKNNIFHKVNAVMRRSNFTGSHALSSLAKTLIGHPFKLFVCANCYVCKMFYSKTLWNRISTQIMEKKEDKKILNKFNKTLEVDDAKIDVSKIKGGEITQPIQSSPIQSSQKFDFSTENYNNIKKYINVDINNNNINKNITDDDINNINSNNTLNSEEKEQIMKLINDRIDNPTSGGIGIKSNTIVTMKVNKQFVNCNECDFQLYYYTPFSLQVDKTTGKLIDLLNFFINNSNNSSGLTKVINLMSGGKYTPTPYYEIHNCDMYVCGNCYNCRLVNSSFRPEHEDVIYRIKHTKNEFNILKKDYDKKHNKLKKTELKDKIITDKTIIKNIQNKIEAKDVKELEKQEKDKKNEFKPVSGEELTPIDEKSAKIIFERKTYKCSICEDTDFFETKTTIKRSKVFNVIGSTQYYFAHPAALYTCKTCLNGVFKYNFLDFPDPKYEYSK